MEKEVVMWSAAIVIGIICALIGVVYKLHSDRIDAKADQDSVVELERRHAEMGLRMTQMHDDNRHASSSMEARIREDYRSMNDNISRMTGRLDQVLMQLARESK